MSRGWHLCSYHTPGLTLSKFVVNTQHFDNDITQFYHLILTGINLLMQRGILYDEHVHPLNNVCWERCLLKGCWTK